jgi:hypothetical protein
MNEQKAAKSGQRNGTKSSIVMYPDVKAAIADLKDEWGFKTTTETIAVAVHYLAQATRRGLPRIDFDDPTSQG